MLKAIKKTLVLLGVRRILTLYNKITHKSIIYNVNNSHVIKSKRCLFVYITEPFCTNKLSDRHQNQWQAIEMARIIGSRGFIVDVADFQSKHIRFKNKYDLVIGLIPRGQNAYIKYMNPGCKQIAYLTSMNLEVTSANEVKRIEECYSRRGVKLEPRRNGGVIEKRIEQFNSVWYIGNEYNYHSYDCFKMPPVHYIKNTGYVFPWATTSIDRDSHSFMYFGSAGQVHKGLDLLLELFAEELKDCILYVCGSFVSEKDFAIEYHQELYNTPNIIPIGFISIESKQYEILSKKCAYSILPSCAEGCAGSVLTNMSAGIIPIVSRECGFEEDEVIPVPDCKKDTIKQYILEYSNKDSIWIKNMSQYVINIVEHRYSKLAFTKSVEDAIDRTLK